MAVQGSFVRKRGGTWSAYFYVPDGNRGRRQRSKGGFPTKGTAQAYLASVVHTVQSGDYVEPSPLTVVEYLRDQWLPMVKMSLRTSTFDSYERMLKLHVYPNIGSIALQRLSPTDLDWLYADLLSQGRSDKTGGLSPKTVRYIHNTIGKALKDAERKGLITRNVARSADPPKHRTSGSHQVVTWTPEEVRTFLAAMEGHRLEAAYFLAVTTGMRRGEVLGLRWRDVELAKGRLAVRQTVTSVNYKITIGAPKTAKGRRSIALDGPTVAVLHSHREQQQLEKAALGYSDQDFVFANTEGAPIHPDFFSQCFDRTVASLPVPKIRLHDLRHTHATIGLAAGVPPKIMSERLGHATVAFTQDVYMHAIPGMQEQAANLTSSLIFGAAGPTLKDVTPRSHHGNLPEGARKIQPR
jgi:integrase